MSNYIKFRGTCKAACEQLIKEDPTLRLVRGHYWCPLWNSKEPHWWCEKNGQIIDPTAGQFPSNGNGEYIEFNGFFDCANCGKKVNESLVHSNVGNHIFCSYYCHYNFVM